MLWALCCQHCAFSTLIIAVCFFTTLFISGGMQNHQARANQIEAIKAYNDAIQISSIWIRSTLGWFSALDFSSWHFPLWTAILNNWFAELKIGSSGAKKLCNLTRSSDFQIFPHQTLILWSLLNKSFIQLFFSCEQQRHLWRFQTLTIVVFASWPSWLNWPNWLNFAQYS